MSSYRLERNNGSCRVVMSGDLTAAAVDELRSTLHEAIASGAHDVEFNLAATGMMDSSGIGLLIGTGNSLARYQGKLRVTDVSPDIFRMLQSMRLVARLNATQRQP